MRTQIPGKQILDQDITTADLADGAVTDPKLSSTGVLPGAFTKVTVNDKGRVTIGANPTTLAGYGITDAVGYADPRFNVSFLSVVDETDLRPGARQVVGVPNQISTVDHGPGAGTKFDIGLASNVIFPGNGAITLPLGTTLQRPAGAPGELRFNTDLSAFELYDSAWESVVLDNDHRLNSAETLIVSNDPGKGQFSSIATALNSITDATATKRYTVKVLAGTYTEPTLQMQRFVSLIAESSQSVLVIAADPNSDFVIGTNDSRIKGVTLAGVTAAGKAAIYFKDAAENLTTRGMLAEDLRFGGNNINIHLVSTGNATSLYAVNLMFGGPTSYDKGVVIESTNGGIAKVLLRACTTIGATAPLPTEFAFVSGVGAEITISGTQLRTSKTSPSGYGVRVNNGGTVRIMGSTMRGFFAAVYAENVGVAPVVRCYNLGLESNTWDLFFEHPGTNGSYLGTAEQSKVISATTSMALSYLDPTNAAGNVVGKFNLGDTNDTLTNVTPLIQETGPVGLLSGAVLSAHPTLPATMNVSAGYGYLKDPTTQKLKYFSWPDSTVSLVDNSANFIYLNSSGVFNTSLTPPNPISTISVGGALSFGGTVAFIGRNSSKIDNIGTYLDEYLRNVFGPIFSRGSIVTANATPFELDVSSGEYYVSRIKFNPTGGTGITFLEFNPNGTFSPTNLVNHTEYNNAGYRTAISTGKFVKHSLYVFEDGADEVYGLVLGQQEYDTLNEAEAGPLPLPPSFFIAPVVVIAGIIVQEGASAISIILDQRPRLGFAPSAVSNTSDHGNLIGLLDDDHPQYLLTNGTRALQADLNLGTFSITNVNLVDGVKVSLHGSRHLPNGADPISTASAVTIGTSSTNAEGIANALARADHTHTVSGFQPLTTSLTNFLAVPSPGLVVHTGSNVWALRTIVSSGGGLTVTNGNGVAGNFDINFAQVGTPGTYVSVTTDQFGSVIAGSTTQAFSTITGRPTTLTGYGITDAQPLDSDLTALAAISTTGIYIVTGNGTSTTRSMQAPAAGITIVNGDGVSGNITLALANDLSALESLSGTGFAVRSGTDAWVQRSLVQPAAGITISNAGGVAANPTFALANDLAALEGLITFGIPVRTSADTWVTRSLTGTFGRVLISNADGVAGSPTFDLGTAGTPGTYVSVTTDAYGRVTSGSGTQAFSTLTATPTTLAGYGITDAQSFDSDLSALANTTSTGIYTITGVGTSATRSVIAGSAKVTVTNGDGVAGNPTIDVAEANLALNNIGGTLSVAKGGTALTALGGVNTVLGVNAAGNGFEYKSFVQGSNIVISYSAGTVTIGAGTVGTAGTYKSVTTDAFGRVTAGTNPTTLSGFGITDAVNVSQLSTANTPNTIPLRDASGNFSAGSITAALIGNASTATKLATARTINGTSFDGTANISFNTDSVPEGTTNLYYTAARSSAAAPVQSVNGRTGAIVITSSDVTNALTYTPVNAATVGQPNGIAALGADGKLSSSQIPASLIGAVVYQGTWNASTNTPTFVSGVGTKGYYYKVSVAGSTTIDGLSQWNVGDTIIFDGTTWDKIDGIASEVISVAGRTGAVVLSTTDVSEGTNLYYTNARASAAAPVQAVAGRTGNIVLSTTDVSEGTNLYYSQSRFDAAFAAKSTANLAEGINLYYTQARFDTAFSAKSTTNLTEGINLYYTQTRFDTAFTAKSTTNLTEGTNLYFTNARASAAAPVQTVAGRTGNVVLAVGDVSNAATAGVNSNITSITGLTTPLSVLQGGTGVTTSTGTGSVVRAVSPALTGTPTTPTAATADNSTAIASTAFVKAQGYITSAVTSVAAAQPAAGITITGSPITSAGTLTFALANDLLALEGLSGTGFAVRTAADTWVQRVLAAGTGIGIINADGVAGNPSIALTAIGTPGTYVSVTTDSTGRVTAGSTTQTFSTITGTPTTLAGYGITDAQPLDSDLTALANTVTTGIYTVTGVGTSATRTITTGSSKVSVTNGNAVAGNPVIDVVEANLSLNNISGTLSIAKGGTALTSTGTANQILGVSATAGTLEYKTITAGAGITIAQSAGAVTIASTVTGTVTSVSAAAPAAGITITGSPITTAGTLTFALVNDLAAVEGLASTGFAVRTAADTWATRAIAAGTGISIVNGDGVSGAPTVTNTGLLSISATQPAAGIAIVGGGTAQAPSFTFNLVNDLGALEALAGTGIAVRTGTDAWAQRSIVAGSGLTVTNGDGLAGNPTVSLTAAATPTSATGLLGTWTLVSGSRYYADFAHNLGTNNLVITLFDTSDNSVVTADSIVLTNTNTVRVTVIGNTRTLRIVVLANGLAINSGTQSAGTITTAKDSVNVSAAASRLNFTGQAVSVTDSGAGTTTVMIGSRFTFFATAFDTPNNPDWVINALSPTVSDPANPALTARQFSNTVEQGVGFLMSIPTGASTITFKIRGRSAVAQGTAQSYQPRIYSRLIPNNGALAAWSAAQNLTALTVPANANFQYYLITASLASLGLAAGNTYQIELTRNIGVANNLAANFLLTETTVEIS